MKRGTYGEVVLSELDTETLKTVRELVNNAGSAEHIDEHGSWEFGCAFDKKQRGQALNWDLYGIGRDVHTDKLLIVVQVRQYEKRYKNGYPNIRKNYFLIGTNEDGTTFAHPVESRVIHAAIRKEADVVYAIQSWIFGVDYERVIRQGDVALVPIKRRPDALEKDEFVATLQDSHYLTAEKLAENGNLYALNPIITHLPATHPTVSAIGWHRIVVGNRAKFWKFAAPTVD